MRYLTNRIKSVLDGYPALMVYVKGSSIGDDNIPLALIIRRMPFLKLIVYSGMYRHLVAGLMLTITALTAKTNGLLDY